jgi:hypothetical protein|tara:strand:+ start:1760 stop:2419 length:660 start_codon:yes stop_codon:yes gene_type:complete
MKIPVSSSHIYFTIGVLLVTAFTSFTWFTCPVDGGTGILTGAELLKVTDIESELIDYEIFDMGCAEVYSDFTYTIKLSLLNETAVTRGGILLVKFYHPSAVEVTTEAEAVRIHAVQQEQQEAEVVLAEAVGKGGGIITTTKRPVATKLVVVEVPPGTAKTIEETVRFQGFGFEQIIRFGLTGVTHTLSVAPPQESIACPISYGTGSVALPEWLRLKAGL